MLYTLTTADVLLLGVVVVLEEDSHLAIRSSRLKTLFWRSVLGGVKLRNAVTALTEGLREDRN